MRSDYLIRAEWAEILRTQGVRAKGYGLIPKYAVQDTELSIAEKAVYAYLCSLAGSQFETFPSVSTIQSHLKIGSRAYSSYMKHLVETGYIVIEKTRAAGNRFDKNLYRITDRPKKFFPNLPRTPKDELIRKTIRADGILGGGYGFIPKLVMFDDRLELKSKGIYAYFAAFTGAGEVAFPPRDQILRELNITKGTYYRYFNPLLDLNYITIQRGKTREFEVNRYILNNNPDECKVKAKHGSKVLCVKFAGTENASTESACTESAGMEFASPEIAGAEKAGITKITVPNNNFPSISSDKYQSYLSYLPKADYLAPIRARILREIDKIDGLDHGELKEELIDWFGFTPDQNGTDHGKEYFERERDLSIIDYMAGAILSTQPLLVHGEKVSPEEIAARFLQLSQEEITEVGERVSEHIAAGEVRNPRAYILAALYDQTISGKLEEIP